MTMSLYPPTIARATPSRGSASVEAVIFPGNPAYKTSGMSLKMDSIRTVTRSVIRDATLYLQKSCHLAPHRCSSCGTTAAAGRCFGNELQRDRLLPEIGRIAGIDEDVGIEEPLIAHD